MTNKPPPKLFPNITYLGDANSEFTHTTLKFKIYQSNKNKYIHQLINIAGCIYNHVLRLQKYYYRYFKKYISLSAMKKHIAWMKNYVPKYNFWNMLNSQAIQDVLERLDTAFKRFFTKLSGFPRLRKVKMFKSFTLKQTGYKFNMSDDCSVDISVRNLNEDIDKKFKNYRLKLHHSYRNLKLHDLTYGNGIQTVTLKRDSLGDLYIYIVARISPRESYCTAQGRTVGIDFGLKRFLTLSDGTVIDAPQELLNALKKLRKLSKELSSKVKFSKNFLRAKESLARLHKRIANKRYDFLHKLTTMLAQKYDTIFIEDLSLSGMSKLWGRKMSDLAYGTFVRLLSYKTKVYKVDRFYPSSQICSSCCSLSEQHKKDKKLRLASLKDRTYECPLCGHISDRDVNASLNLEQARHGYYLV